MAAAAEPATICRFLYRVTLGQIRQASVNSGFVQTSKSRTSREIVAADRDTPGPPAIDEAGYAGIERGVSVSLSCFSESLIPIILPCLREQADDMPRSASPLSDAGRFNVDPPREHLGQLPHLC
jgi:hypothetical protein